MRGTAGVAGLDWMSSRLSIAQKRSDIMESLIKACYLS